MKKIAKYIIIIAIIFIVGFVNHKIYNKNKILKISNIERKLIGKLIYKYQTDPNFLGDGEKILIYELNLNNYNDLNDKKNWNEIDRMYNLILDDRDAIDKYSLPRTGYYLAYDQQDNKYKKIEEIYNKNFKSYNYILIILDFNNKRIIYYELNT